MVKVTNNFLDNNEFEKLIKTFSFEGLNWNFENCKFFEDKEDAQIMCYKMICKNIEDFFNFKKLEDTINLSAIKKINARLITKSNQKVSYPVEENEKPLMVYFLNTNNGFFDVKGIGQIECVENRIVYLPSKSLSFHSSCTDKDYKMYLEIHIPE